MWRYDGMRTETANKGIYYYYSYENERKKQNILQTRISHGLAFYFSFVSNFVLFRPNVSMYLSRRDSDRHKTTDCANEPLNRIASAAN